MGIDKVSVAHLADNGSNFLDWRSDVLDIAAEKHLDIPKYIKGRLDPAYDLDGHDDAGMRIMRLRMGSVNKSLTRHAISAHEMMSILEKTYMKSGIGSQVSVRQRLADLRADESTDIPKHCTLALDLRSQLYGLDAPIPDEQFCKTLLMSLPPSWQSFSSGFKAEQFLPKTIKTIVEEPETITAQVPALAGLLSATSSTSGATGGATGGAAGAGGTTTATTTTTAPAPALTFTFMKAKVVEEKEPADVTPHDLVRRINDEYETRRAKDAPADPPAALLAHADAPPPVPAPHLAYPGAALPDEFVWRAVQECFNCGEEGHFSRDCTKPRTPASIRADIAAGRHPRGGPPPTRGFAPRGRGGRPYRAQPGRAMRWKGRVYLFDDQDEQEKALEIIDDVPPELQAQVNTTIEDVAAMNFAHVWSLRDEGASTPELVQDDLPHGGAQSSTSGQTLAQPLNPHAAVFVPTGAYSVLIANTPSNLLDVPAGVACEPEDPIAPSHSHAVTLSMSADMFFYDSGANVNVVNNRDLFETSESALSWFSRSVPVRRASGAHATSA